MENLDPQPQYYSLDPAPQPQKPWFQNKRILLMIGAGIFAMGFVALLIVFTLNSMKSSTSEVNKISVLNTQLSNCDAERDPEACKSRARSGMARNEADPELCKGLIDDEFSSCVTIAAKENGDVSACASLPEGAERDSCKNLAWLSAAQTGTDLSICEKIGDSDIVKACIDSVTAAAVASGECSKARVDESLCTGRNALDAAILLGTEASCMTLAEDLQTDCTNAIYSVDEDGDGLVIASEVENGTSDQMADTDGDGYTDGVEVEMGFDPLK